MEQTNTQTATTTVVGVFDDYSAAERASHQLMDNGIERSAIQIQSNFRTGAAGSVGDSAGESSHEGGFMGWWHSLFNDDDARSEGGDYAEAAPPRKRHLNGHNFKSHGRAGCRCDERGRRRRRR